MDIFLNKSSIILHGFLKKESEKKRPVRRLSDGELALYHELRELRKEANICITEMLLISRIVKAMNEKDMMWIFNNFQRMTHSVKKQKDLLSATIAAITGLKPNDEELAAIKKLVTDFQKRIQFLNAVPIPENIELTPLKEYIELIGKDRFIDDLRREFHTGFDMYDSVHNGKLEEYVSEILLMVHNAGKDELYKERLAKYVEIANARKKKNEREKEEERIAKAKNESRNGIDLFMELFFKGVRTLQGCSKIGLGEQSIRRAVSQGHRGEFVILCCGFARDKLYYRYLRDNGALGNTFGVAGKYKQKNEAEERMRRAESMNPDKSFMVVAI